MVHRRPDVRDSPGSWSFPGGHIDPGETAPEALVRGFREELAVTAAEAALEENDEIRWVRASDLGRIRLAHWSCEKVILDYARHRAGGV